MGKQVAVELGRVTDLDRAAADLTYPATLRLSVGGADYVTGLCVVSTLDGGVVSV